MEDKFKKIESIVEKELSYCPGHNMDHVRRVYNLAIHLAQDENVDLEVIKLATLLHDIGGKRELDDPTGQTDHAVESVKMAEDILNSFGYSEEKTRHIQDCILSHRFKTNNKPKTKEAQIVFDADKLDVTGAIGLARAFVWVGKNDAHIYRKVDIDQYIKENLSGGEINGRIKDKSQHSPQIEFETKLKSLGDKLYTNKAKEIFKKRFEYVESYLDRLEKEIKGEI